MPPIKYVSTRGGGEAVTVSAAIERGLAVDGGLYLPQPLPKLDVATMRSLTALPQIAVATLQGFLSGDALAPALVDIAQAAFNFPAPTTQVEGCEDPLYALELFHGPTAAFKDFGAQFLAQSLARLHAPGTPPMSILVATSGDTGGAVAAAFHDLSWARVIVLYPKGLVSLRQEQQLTCWGGNVKALRVAGTFDDCQRMVKAAFADPQLRARHRLSSANSINVGRLLPQIVYYAASSLDIERRTGHAAGYVIPAGNLGNAFAAMWARALGLPIGRIILAHNANRTVPDYLDTGDWQPRPSIATLASAMDVGNPSNMERVRALYPGITALREQLSAQSIDDATIRSRIQEDFMHYAREWCPHTATAAEVYAGLSDAERRAHPWVLVATAHPAKFNDIVEPLIDKVVSVPTSLERLLHLPQTFSDVQPTLEALAHALE